MDQQTHLKRLRWGCRRGMLELDLILIPFIDEQYSSLTSELKNDFEALLLSDDPELYRWLMGNGLPPDAYHVIVSKIRASITEPVDPL